MVDFEGYYSFAADQVEYVETGTKASDSHPYTLSVALKSGKRLVVSYNTQTQRDAAKRTLLNRIAAELRRDYEYLCNKVFLIGDTVRRIDKRQLRIWQQLNCLLETKEK